MFWEPGHLSTYTDSGSINSLPTARLLSGLTTFLQFLSGDCKDLTLDTSGALASAAAKSFAVATDVPEIAQAPQHSFGPLPASLWSAVNLSVGVHGSPWPTELPAMKPDEWSFLLIHEHATFKSRLPGHDTVTKERLRWASPD